jgi:acyl carrier protein
MFNCVEPRVRRLVAEHLGIGLDELSPIVSLTDDLAADSLDLVELAMAIEQELGIVMPDTAMADVRTYGDLLAVVEAIRRAPQDNPSEPPAVWARIVRERDELHRAGWLTPYTAETIAEDAARGGRGTRLEMIVSPGASDAVLEHLDEQFAWLRRRGIEVCVSREAVAVWTGPAAAKGTTADPAANPATSPPPGPRAGPRAAGLGVRS